MQTAGLESLQESLQVPNHRIPLSARGVQESLQAGRTVQELLSLLPPAGSNAQQQQHGARLFLYTSPFLRCIQTAQHITRALDEGQVGLHSCKQHSLLTQQQRNTDAAWRIVWQHVCSSRASPALLLRTSALPLPVSPARAACWVPGGSAAAGAGLGQLPGVQDMPTHPGILPVALLHTAPQSAHGAANRSIDPCCCHTRDSALQLHSTALLGHTLLGHGLPGRLFACVPAVLPHRHPRCLGSRRTTTSSG